MRAWTPFSPSKMLKETQLKVQSNTQEIKIIT